MLLTNKEVLKLHEKTDDVFELAEAIERAVLAKAMPIPKQDPDYWKIGGLGGDIITNKKSEFDLAERFNWPVEPLYKHPVPAQAAAIPEGFVDAFDHILDLLEYVTDKPMIIPEPTDNTIMRSVKKIVTKLRDLSAAPKP